MSRRMRLDEHLKGANSASTAHMANSSLQHSPIYSTYFEHFLLISAYWLGQLSVSLRSLEHLGTWRELFGPQIYWQDPPLWQDFLDIPLMSLMPLTTNFYVDASGRGCVVVP